MVRNVNPNFLNLCTKFSKQQVKPTLYLYNVLKSTTKIFHHDNKLGKGGFGVVYKVSLYHLNTPCYY
jgi:hypothetical protein